MISTTSVLIALLIAAYVFSTLRARVLGKLPPGPRPLPVLGNILDMTTKELWLRVNHWAEQYGPMTHLRFPGMHIIFLNTAESAFELLEKRGAIYSSKPRLVMVGEMCGCANMVPFTPYDDTFKRRRKLMQQTLGPRSIPKYYDNLTLSTKRFMASIMEDPQNYLRHIRRYSGGLMLSVVYGYEAASSNDKYLRLAEESMDLLANEMAPGPGIWPVDIIPMLQYLPSWLPGGSFKRKAVVWKKKMQAFVDLPYAEAKDIMARGESLPSFCHTLFEESTLSPMQEEDLKWTANSMYAASADTTIATISHLILAMILYPSIFDRARREMDEVVGRERLPTFKDRESLPYLECILNETWRWGCPVPLNLPHMLEEEDEYLGYRIPKDSLVIANMWSMSRDPAIYPAPETFNPDRFLKPEPGTEKLMDPRNYIFGFGRRRCPAADLVNSSIWLLMATMIATIEISRPVHPDGSEVDLDIDFTNLFFRIPKAFPFCVKPRSKLVGSD